MVNSKIMEKQDTIIEMVSNFCDDELNEQYKNLAISLIKKMGHEENIPFKRGKLEIWASAIIYSLGQINFLFDKLSEPYKTPDDICNYFNTKKSTVSQKAKIIRDMFGMENFDKEFSVDSSSKEVVISESKLSEKLSDISLDKDKTNHEVNYSASEYFDYHSDFTTLEEFEDAIVCFEKEKGPEYFEQNKGNFWQIVETRQYMQDVFDHATFLWECGQKERATDSLYRLLELNPNDNQGVRDFLVNYLINLNRLEDAEKLLNQYPNEISANWKYSKLLIAIKNKENKKIINELYDDAFESNNHIVDYIFNKKQIDEIPKFYSLGDENEAKVYKLMSSNNWNDKKTLKRLRKAMK